MKGGEGREAPIYQPILQVKYIDLLETLYVYYDIQDKDIIKNQIKTELSRVTGIDKEYSRASILNPNDNITFDTIILGDRVKNMIKSIKGEYGQYTKTGTAVKWTVKSLETFTQTILFGGLGHYGAALANIQISEGSPGGGGTVGPLHKCADMVGGKFVWLIQKMLGKKRIGILYPNGSDIVNEWILTPGGIDVMGEDVRVMVEDLVKTLEASEPQSDQLQRKLSA